MVNFRKFHCGSTFILLNIFHLELNLLLMLPLMHIICGIYYACDRKFTFWNQKTVSYRMKPVSFDRKIIQNPSKASLIDPFWRSHQPEELTGLSNDELIYILYIIYLYNCIIYLLTGLIMDTIIKRVILKCKTQKKNEFIQSI